MPDHTARQLPVNVMLIAVVVIPDPQRTVSGLPVCRGAARVPIIRGITLAYVITQVVAFQ